MKKFIIWALLCSTGWTQSNLFVQPNSGKVGPGDQLQILLDHGAGLNQIRYFEVEIRQFHGIRYTLFAGMWQVWITNVIDPYQIWLHLPVDLRDIALVIGQFDVVVTMEDWLGQRITESRTYGL